jgi:hypothetical protein
MSGRGAAGCDPGLLEIEVVTFGPYPAGLKASLV